MIRLGFLASNNGSGLRAAVGAIEGGELDAQVRLVVSNKPAAPALAFAREHGLATLVIPTVRDADGADARLARAMSAASVQWIVLSGYLRKLGPRTLAGFPDHILNIHPSLLPKFGGRGLYGRRVHEAVIAAGERISGASVHLVDEHYDHGAVLARCELPVGADETAEALERRVTAAEPELLVQTLRRLASRDGILWDEQWLLRSLSIPSTISDNIS